MKKRIIIIENVEDYNKLIKKIKIYKSILYRNKFFECSCNPIFKDVPFIIEALNIKKKKQRINYVYEYCCRYIDDYCKNKDFCKFKNNKCLTQYNNEYFNGCCRGCRFQSKNGCMTSNLTCKLYYCSKVKNNHKVITINDLKILKCLSVRNNIIIKHDFFSSKQEMLNDLYLNSILIFTFKTLFRFRYIRKMTKRS